MPAVKRRIFNVLAAVSLVLCVVSALHALSPPLRDWEWHDVPQWDFTTWELEPEDMGLIVRHYTPVEPRVPGPPSNGGGGGSSPQYLAWVQRVQPWQFDRLGFRLSRNVPMTAGASSDCYALKTELRAPYWLICAITSIAPAMLLVSKLRSRWRQSWRRRQAQQNLCLTCGYDLRATPYRCPECGTPVPRWLYGRIAAVGER
jgi:hypothetical protein